LRRGEGGIEKREGREEKQNDRVEQPIYDKRGQAGCEGNLRFLSQSVGPGDFSGARGQYVVHHHSDRCRAPQRTKRDSRCDRLEDRSPAERPNGENRGGAKNRPDEEKRVCFRKFLRYFGRRDPM
jgi:hypothetical protein